MGCCKCKWFDIATTWAETNCVTRWLGGIGFSCLARHRRNLFRFSAVAVFCSIVLTCFAAVALSPDKGTLVDFPWAHASGKMIDNSTDTEISGEMFIGLTGIVRDLKTYNKQTGTTQKDLRRLLCLHEQGVIVSPVSAMAAGQQLRTASRPWHWHCCSPFPR